MTQRLARPGGTCLTLGVCIREEHFWDRMTEEGREGIWDGGRGGATQFDTGVLTFKRPRCVPRWRLHCHSRQARPVMRIMSVDILAVLPRTNDGR